MSKAIRSDTAAGKAEGNVVEVAGKPKERKSVRRKTSHLKLVPETKALREAIRDRCNEVAQALDKSRPPSKDEMEVLVRTTLDAMGQPEGFVGWTMVALASAFWKDQVAAVPPARRLFLLPHCLKHAEGCPADYDDFGLDCKRCGACSIADFRTVAEEMGYKVLVAEGSPIVLKIIVSGYVDAIIGVACLNVLERAIDKILLAGIPCLAVPLLSSDCRNTSVDEDWVHEMIHLRQSTAPAQTRSYLHLLRAADRLLEPDSLQRLAPPLRNAARRSDSSKSGSETARRSEAELPDAELPVAELPVAELPDGQLPGRNSAGQNAADQALADRRLATDASAGGNSNGRGLERIDAIAATEILAHEFLAKGGKHSRPFITLAAYDALTGGGGTLADGADYLDGLPDAVRRTALSIETFHKASLIHDDIEDDDSFRYGEATMHRRYGIPTAINVGDYLIGLGYRLISREAGTLGSDVAAEIIDHLADAHMKLSEGQGAELLWRDSRDKSLSPIDALKIYALKTAPAFDAALYAGVRLAQPVDDALRDVLRQLAKNVGIAFQILNDLKDWRGDRDNKLTAGGDVLHRRPTVLWALAMESLAEWDRKELETLVADRENRSRSVSRIRQLYTSAGAFEKANRLVDKYQERAESIADSIEADELRRLIYYLIDTVLERPAEEVPTLVTPLLPSGATVVA